MNVERRSFGHIRFTELIAKVALLPIPEQGKAFEVALEEYQKNAEQRDDITLLGIKI